MFRSKCSVSITHSTSFDRIRINNYTFNIQLTVCSTANAPFRVVVYTDCIYTQLGKNIQKAPWFGEDDKREVAKNLPIEYNIGKGLHDIHNPTLNYTRHYTSTKKPISWGQQASIVQKSSSKNGLLETKDMQDRPQVRAWRWWEIHLLADSVNQHLASLEAIELKYEDEVIAFWATEL